MLNRISLMGRLTRDPELRTTASGVSVTSFSLAVDRDFKGQDGEKETDFIDIVAWRNTAEFVCKYLSKGRMAIVDGRLQIRSWTDKDGNARHSAEVVADSVYFGDSKRDDESGRRDGGYGNSGKSGAAAYGQPNQPPSYSNQSAYPSSDYGDVREMLDDDGDLPF